MSAIDVWQGAIMSVILTGMGLDGMRGGKEIVAAGGSVIAQDEAPAWSGACRERLQTRASAPRSCRSTRLHQNSSACFGRPLVNLMDYEFLRKLLKERSGLDLSADKQYLVESRLLPLARKAWSARHRRTGAEAEGAAPTR